MYIIYYLKNVKKKSRKEGINDNLAPGSIVKLLFSVPADNKRFKLVSRVFSAKLKREYGVTEVLDFEKMEPAKAKKKKIAPTEKKKAPTKE